MKTTLLLAIALLCSSTQAQTPANSTPAPVSTLPPPAKPGPANRHARQLHDGSSSDTAGNPSRTDSDAGSRTKSGANLPALYVLAPSHTGLSITTHAQPSLFWYQSAPTNIRIELTVTKPKESEPLLHCGIDGPCQPGIHRLLLARFKDKDQNDVTLKTGVVYRWTVSFVRRIDGGPFRRRCIVQ